MHTTTHAYVLGPQTATLTVRTRKGGAIAKAGHNLRIEVTAWRATLDLGDEPSVELTADARSLRVREGAGGVQSLDSDDMAGIDKTIDEEVLKGAEIAFRSTKVTRTEDGLDVEGTLELGGVHKALAFKLGLDGDRFTGTATVRQTAFGIKPYTALFGTLKVLDEVQVEVAGTLPDHPVTDRSTDG